MEAIGVAASIISLLQIVRTLQNAAQFLLKHHYSTSDIHRLSEKIDDLSTKLHLLKIVEQWAASCDSLLQESELEILGSSLLAAQKEILHVRDVCERCGKCKGSVAKRIKWIIREGHIWNDLASRVQEAQASLAFTTQILDMKIATLARIEIKNSADCIRNGLGLILELLDRKSVRPVAAKDLATNQLDNGLSNLPQPNKRIFTMTLWLLQYWWIKYGVQLALAKAEKTFFTPYNLALKMPIPTITGKSTITIDLVVRNYLLRPPDISCRMAMRRIIPASSDIVKACESQDLVKVRDLLLQHKAGPNDMTEDYRPLLWHAIDGGSTEVIRLLLSFGADATILSGYSNAGLLHIAFYCRQPEIARMLISNGADPENINLNGTTPLFQLFQPDQESTETPAIELIQMLTPHSLSCINTQSCEGWTPLHRAAAYGTRQDVDCLIKRGANLTLKTYREQWPPIFVAVDSNNIDTFDQLAHYSTPECFQDTDIRGWTMLHIAAAIGNSELIAILIDLGADPHASSNPSSELSNDLIPENIRGLELTPADVAKYSGSGKFRAYIYGLMDAGIDISSNSEEIFWPAEN